MIHRTWLAFFLLDCMTNPPDMLYWRGEKVKNFLNVGNLSLFSNQNPFSLSAPNPEKIMKTKSVMLQSCLMLLAFCLFSQAAFGQNIISTYTGEYSGADHGNVKITVDSLGSNSCQFDSAVTGKSFIVYGTSLNSLIVNCSGDIVDNATNFNDWAANGSIVPGSNGKSVQGHWFHTYLIGNTSYHETGAFLVSLVSNSFSPQSISGLWYDPAYSGSGFNIFMSSVGLMVTYYGWDSNRNRLWLLSDIGPTQVAAGTAITLNMTRTSGSSFPTLKGSSTNGTWGTLTLNLSSCTAGTATLTGADGSVTENIILLVGITGAPGC